MLQLQPRSAKLGIDRQKSSVILSKICEGIPTLQNILGFTVGELHISYLSLPITGQKFFYNQCWKLIQPIENLLSRLRGKCLSYGGRIQLVNWIITGRYIYWAQGICISIYLGWEKITWSQMILPKNGGLGIWDHGKITEAIPIKNAVYFSIFLGPKPI